MANWQRTLDLTPNFAECDDTDSDQIRGLAKFVAKKLRELKPFGTSENPHFLDGDREYLVEDFEALADDEYADVNAFNYVLVRLYDWGDAPLERPGKYLSLWKKACWIKTF